MILWWIYFILFLFFSNKYLSELKDLKMLMLIGFLGLGFWLLSQFIGLFELAYGLGWFYCFVSVVFGWTYYHGLLAFFIFLIPWWFYLGFNFCGKLEGGVE